MNIFYHKYIIWIEAWYLSSIVLLVERFNVFLHITKYLYRTTTDDFTLKVLQFQMIIFLLRKFSSTAFYIHLYTLLTIKWRYIIALDVSCTNIIRILLVFYVFVKFSFEHFFFIDWFTCFHIFIYRYSPMFEYLIRFPQKQNYIK